MPERTFDIEEKSVSPQLVASIRMQGKYSDCGKGFKKIARKFGRYLCGKPLMMYYDKEYRENDANFEVAMPIRRGESTDEINVYELAGGRCLSLMHLGPYEDLRGSYEKMMSYANDNQIAFCCPSREVYHKGPGMIFKGNPKKYLTEIQLMLNDE